MAPTGSEDENTDEVTMGGEGGRVGGDSRAHWGTGLCPGLPLPVTLVFQELNVHGHVESFIRERNRFMKTL
jgi:hypothetical protein